MVEDIKLVKNWDVAHLQDLLLMVFWRSVKEIIIEMIGTQDGSDGEGEPVAAVLAEIGEDGGAAALGGAVGEEDGGEAAARRGAVGEVPGKLVAAGVALIEAIDAMMIAFRKVNIKAMSKDIKEKDSERDALLREVKSMTAVMANIKSLSERQAAAKALKESMARWKLNPKHEYNREFMEVSSWLKVVAASPELTAAAEVLGMTEMITRLGELNDEVNALIDERDAALANKKAKQQRQKRKEAERRWRTFVMMLNAAALMDDDEHRYDAIVGFLNYRLKDLKKKMRHTRRMNAKKREVEESDND